MHNYSDLLVTMTTTLGILNIQKNIVPFLVIKAVDHNQKDVSIMSILSCCFASLC